MRERGLCKVSGHLFGRPYGTIISVMVITSLQNPKIKHALQLRERRHRKREGLMLVEGYDEIALALTGGAKPLTLFFCPQFFGDVPKDDLLARAGQGGVELIEVNERVFEKMAYRENPDGWLAIIPSIQRGLSDLHLGFNPLLVVVEAVEKPGNLGAILRSADAGGVDGVILCDPTVDLGNPNVARPSRGALFTVPVAESSSTEALLWLRERKIQIVAATPEAIILYTDADLRGPVAVVVGAEKKGLSAVWRDGAEVAARIPMVGRVNSLNVAAATTLFIFEAVRQRSVQ